jgi:hypothetical protein
VELRSLTTPKPPLAGSASTDVAGAFAAKEKNDRVDASKIAALRQLLARQRFGAQSRITSELDPQPSLGRRCATRLRIIANNAFDLGRRPSCGAYDIRL